MTPVVEGHATIVFTTTNDGRVDDAVIISASHPAFGDSVMAASQNWIIDNSVASSSAPAVLGRRESLLYEFRRQGTIVSLTQREKALALFSESLDGERSIRVVAWRDLASSPRRVHSPNPVYPATLRVLRTTGSATVNYIIDMSGAVRVPAVIAADHPEFAEAAIAAIKQWRFEPISHNGQVVNVEAERRFFFGKSH